MIFNILLFTSLVTINSYVLTEFSSNSNQFIPKKNNNYNPFTDFGSSVTLMRHANTFNNQNNIYTGKLNPGILDINQKKIPMGKYDLVLSSSSLRCKQTLDLLHFDNKPEIIYDDCFLEAGYGDLTGKTKDEEIFKRKFFNRPPESDFYVSESIFEAGVRAYFGFSLLSDKYTMFNSKILVLSHKNTLKGLWSFLNLDYLLTQDDDKDLYDMEIDIQNLIESKKIPDFGNLEKYDIDLF